MKESRVLGVDIGGSHITTALVDVNTHRLLGDTRLRLRVNSGGSVEEIVTTWCTAMRDVFDKNEITDRRVGIAMPGPFDYERGVSLIKGLDKYESLYGLYVKELIAAHLQIEPTHIRMMNDAACFLQGEVDGGCAVGYQHVIGITLGTGTGSAIHHDGITKDANLGPSPFMDSIADEYFSTRWFVKRYKELTGIEVKDVKALIEKYFTDARVKQLFEEFAQNLCIFLRDFVKRESPQVIVMGGNIAQSANLFMANLKENLQHQGIETPIVIASLGEDAAMLGAAGLFNEKK